MQVTDNRGLTPLCKVTKIIIITVYPRDLQAARASSQPIVLQEILFPACLQRLEGLEETIKRLLSRVWQLPRE